MITSETARPPVPPFDRNAGDKEGAALATPVKTGSQSWNRRESVGSEASDGYRAAFLRELLET